MVAQDDVPVPVTITAYNDKTFTYVRTTACDQAQLLLLHVHALH